MPTTVLNIGDSAVNKTKFFPYGHKNKTVLGKFKELQGDLHAQCGVSQGETSRTRTQR